MAKKKAPEQQQAEQQDAQGEKSKRYQVAIDTDLVKQIKFLAADADVSPPDWVNNQLRKIVAAEWPRIVEQLTPK